MVEGYIRKEVSKILGMRPATVQLYTDKGIVTPEVSAPVGRGTTRIYSKKNLLELAIVRELGSKGITLATIKKIFSMMQKIGGEEYKHFDPDHGLIQSDRVYLMVFDPDKENRHVSLTWNWDPEKGPFPPGLEDKRGRILEDRDRITLKMSGFTSAVVLDLSKIWGGILRKI